MEVAAHHDVRLALSDTLRIAAEGIGARLRTGSLAGPVETQIRGRSGSLTVWLWRGEQPAVNQRMHPDAAE
jgi:adenylate cyclase